jgi:polyvinyl alcohol dehydrogenase (cytochrome)
MLIADLSIAADWPMHGANSSNTASNASTISTSNVSSLTLAWTTQTGGDVSARAAVVNGVAYFPDWAGNINAVNASNGTVIWSKQLSSYGLAGGTYSRTSPAVANGVVYIGTQFNPSGPTGWLLAIDATTGNLDWKMQPERSGVSPVITASPVVSGGVVYVGMTSNEEFIAGELSTYVCCSDRGSVAAVNASTGELLWKTYTVPDKYSGANVWGSTPVVDAARKMVYVGTGNNYSEPKSYQNCMAGGGTPQTCLPPDDHVDSVIALDMKTGQIKWATRLITWNQDGSSLQDPYQVVTGGSDFWNTSCGGLFGYAGNCPGPGLNNGPTAAGPDYDLASGPNEITFMKGNTPTTIIGVGQKSGVYYALNPNNGAILWQTQVGPGSSLGGIEWGCASDGTSIYVAIGNLYGLPYTLANSQTVANAGSWAALDPATGAIKWQVADPNGALDLGPMAVANGVVYAPSMGGFGPASNTNPTMFALDASTGNVLWSYVSGESVLAGASIAGDTVYWGAGYLHFGAPLATGGNANSFFAFRLPAP